MERSHNAYKWSLCLAKERTEVSKYYCTRCHWPLNEEEFISMQSRGMCQYCFLYEKAVQPVKFDDVRKVVQNAK